MEVDSPNPTPSLLERLGETRRGGGAQRAARRAGAPYQKRTLGLSNADADAVWKHDKHEPLKLAERLGREETRPRIDMSNVRKALGQHHHSNSVSEGLSIKGASSSIVEVKGLVAGTTPEDVKAIFQSCGAITKAVNANTSSPQSPHVHLYYTQADHAQAAVAKFNGIPADGQTLSVTIYSPAQQIVQADRNQDLLLEFTPARPAGKMYSDQIDDPRASVIVGDFSIGEPWKGGRGRGRGNGNGRRGRGGSRRGGLGAMDIDG